MFFGGERKEMFGLGESTRVTDGCEQDASRRILRAFKISVYVLHCPSLQQGKGRERVLSSFVCHREGVNQGPRLPSFHPVTPSGRP